MLILLRPPTSANFAYLRLLPKLIKSQLIPEGDQLSTDHPRESIVI